MLEAQLKSKMLQSRYAPREAQPSLPLPATPRVSHPADGLRDRARDQKLRLRNSSVEYILEESQVNELWSGYRKILKPTTDVSIFRHRDILS